MSHRGWFVHRETQCPVDKDKVVEVEFEDRSRRVGAAGSFGWISVVKYRIVEYRVNDQIGIMVPWTEHPSFDRALESAMRQAIMRFDVDGYGYFNNVFDADRGSHSIHITFDRLESLGGVGGWTHYYHFKAKVVCE